MKKALRISAALLLVGVILIGCPPTKPAAPAVTSFSLDDEASTTTSPAVTLNNVCTGSPTQYMASESASFSGASWMTYSAAPSFTLSSGAGVKTVYFKVKSAAGASTAVNDTIELEDNTGEDETVMLPGSVSLDMEWCPAGTFLMGAATDEQDSTAGEKPRHQVTLTHGFWIGKYELTKRQWTAVMGATPWSGQDGIINDLDSPAVYVSWNDAQAFVTALNAYTGKTFRLPTEAEWEYACRAETTTRFYWGDDLTDTQIGPYAWYWANYGSEPYAHVVGQKLPNNLGLYDMSGNAWEWVQDWKGDYPNANPVNDPAGAATGTDRVLRGGGWGFYAYMCRSAYRGGGSPSGKGGDIGFRISR